MHPVIGEGPNGSIPEQFEHVAARHSERLALADGRVSWTYANLLGVVNRFAREITDRWGHQNEPVGLLFGHEAIAVAATLAVLRAGKTYVPLESFAPPGRHQDLLNRIECRRLITDSAHRAQAEAIAGSALSILELDATAAGASAPPLCPMPPADAPAAILFTSGSTGLPKMVSRTHANILRRVQYSLQECDTRQEDVFSYLYGYNNAASLSDLYGSLLTGATLRIYDVRQAGLERMALWLDENRVSILHMNSSLLRTFLNQLPAGESLRHIRVARVSQRLFTADIRRLRAIIPQDAFIFHRYALTEFGSVTSIKIDSEMVISGDTVPVGRPLPGVEIGIIDDTGAPVTDGTVGEIIVRSPSMSPAADPDTGFFHTGDLGRLRPDGMLELAGRADSLVKIRGFRVSLTAIEDALRQTKLVTEAVAVAQPDRNGDRVPIAYVVAGTDSPGLATELRRRLSERLPPYALPAQFILLESLPRTLNGKVDYQALPPFDGTRPALATPYAPPRTPFEVQLAAIWSEVLGIEPVGVHDRFLDLGGHSLLATMIVSRVIRAMNIDISPPILLQAPTVAEMAAVLVAQEISKLADAELDGLLSDLEEGEPA